MHDSFAITSIGELQWILLSLWLVINMQWAEPHRAPQPLHPLGHPATDRRASVAKVSDEDGERLLGLGNMV